jgi:D-cysteine desulfhydrase
MAGMLDLLEKGAFKQSENVLFLHSGGTPALFPYRDGIIENLSSDL